MTPQVIEHKRNSPNLPKDLNYFGYSLGHAITEVLLPALLQDVASLMNKYSAMRDIWPFNQPVFRCREFEELRRSVHQMVTLSAPPLPLRTMVEGLWTWAQGLSGSGGPSTSEQPSQRAVQATGARWTSVGQSTSEQHNQGTDQATGVRWASVGPSRSEQPNQGTDQATGTRWTSVGPSRSEQPSQGAVQATGTRWTSVIPSTSEQPNQGAHLVRENIIRLGWEASQLRGKDRREKLIEVWRIAGDQLAGSDTSEEGRFLAFAREYFQGNASVPPLIHMIHGNQLQGGVCS